MISKNQIKQVTALQQKKERDEERLFIAEGVKTVEEILLQKPKILSHLYAPDYFISTYSQIIEQHQIDYSPVTYEELKRISLQVKPNQVLAVCKYFELETDIKPNTQLYLYLDDIRDPGNMGTIIRLADWFGMDTVFCSPNCVDIYNPKVIQSCMGAFLRVKTVYDELENIQALHSFERIYGAVMDGNSIYNSELKPSLLIIGNEANGISEANLLKINHPITIPSHPSSGTESLNAAIATALICGEFFRQSSK